MDKHGDGGDRDGNDVDDNVVVVLIGPKNGDDHVGSAVHYDINSTSDGDNNDNGDDGNDGGDAC